MASNKSIDANFTWGDAVVIKDNAPKCYSPGSPGCICGIRTVDSLLIAAEFHQPLHSELFLVELSNGSTLEVPKLFLELLPPK